MPNLLIRNLPEETVAALKARAARQGRSLQQELRLALERLALERHADGAEAADRIRERLLASGRVFTDSTELIREDRDSR